MLGFFGWVFYFIYFILPVAFPLSEEAGKADPSQGGKFKVNETVIGLVQDLDMDKMAIGKVTSLRDKEFKSYDEFINQLSKTMRPEDLDKVKKATRKFGRKKDKYTHWWSPETILDPDNMPWSVLLFVFVLLLGVSQAGIIAIASVKMSSLESYQWSLTGCIVAMVPLLTFPIFVFIAGLMDLSDYLLEGDWSDVSWIIALAGFLWGPVVGGLCLKAFLQPQVKPGFEFKPD